jgi:NADH-quinone oxidoreductase subunit H
MLLAFLVLGLGQDGINISVALLQTVTFIVKLLMMNFFFIWVRWTLVRFRYDQLQNLAWKVLLPIAIVNIFFTGIFVVVMGA